MQQSEGSGAPKPLKHYCVVKKNEYGLAEKWMVKGLPTRGKKCPIGYATYGSYQALNFNMMAPE
jgi:hypothetical protein